MSEGRTTNLVQARHLQNLPRGKAAAKAREAKTASKSGESSEGEPETAAKPKRRKATRKPRKGQNQI